MATFGCQFLRGVCATIQKAKTDNLGFGLGDLIKLGTPTTLFLMVTKLSGFIENAPGLVRAGNIASILGFSSGGFDYFSKENITINSSNSELNNEESTEYNAMN